MDERLCYLAIFDSLRGRQQTGLGAGVIPAIEKEIAMNRKILKYELPITFMFNLDLPKDWVFCDINNQFDRLYLWAMIKPESPIQSQTFRILGTGHDIPFMDSLYFLKTVPMPDGFVWHVFTHKV